MTDAYDMVYVAQCKLQELVCEYSASVSKAKEAVVREDSPQPHSPGMEYSLVAQTTKTSMAMDDLDSFAYHDVAEHGKEGEDGGERSLAVDDEEWDVVDFETVGEVPHACSTGIGMCDNNYFVAAIDKFLGPG
jgi:hypothetical protein